MILRVRLFRALVPVWIVLVGVAASWSPTPTVPIAVLLLILTVGIIPGLATLGAMRRPSHR
jgi:hypothetical protein